MESVVRTVAKQKRLFVISPLIKIVPQLMMDGRKILGRNVEADLHAQIVVVIDIPRAGMAHYLAIVGLHEQTPLPERRRQRREAQRFEEILPKMHHIERLRSPRFENLGEIVPRI